MAAEMLTGGETAWVSDVDKGANKILAHRYPDVPNLGDFTVMDWSTVEPIEILTAGYPCQPFSHAGKRAGTNDARHLWPEVLRCLTTLRPPFALFENVRGHLSLGFDQVLADLATHDYDARWIVLRAADIGAPHGRARLFILAADARRGGDRWDLVGAGRGAVRVGGVRREGASGGGDAGGADLLGGKLMPTPRASDGEKGGPNQRGSSGDLMLPSAVAQLLPTPTSRDWKDHTIRREPHRPEDTDTLARALTDVPCALLPTPTSADSKASGGSTPSDVTLTDAVVRTDMGTKEKARLLQTPSAADGLGGHERRGGARGEELLLNGQAKEMHGAQWGDYAPAIHRWEQILGRPAPAPTMTSAKGNPQLSPRFVEWMMGLPEGWVDDVPGLTRNEKLKALGNGVVSQQAVEAVLRLLALGERVAA